MNACRACAIWLLLIPACAALVPTYPSLCRDVPCFDRSPYPGGKIRRTGGFAPAAGGESTRLCDADGAVECGLHRDLWFEVEPLSGFAGPVFRVDHYVSGIACRTEKDLEWRLLTDRDGPLLPAGIDPEPAEAPAADDARHCGRWIIRFPGADTLSVDTVLEATDVPTGRAVRFFWTGAELTR